MSRRVFVMEDDETLAELWADVLRRGLDGADIKTFGDGVSAMNEIDDSGPPDLIILDIILNGPSGFALLNELRGYADTTRIPVIICSNLAPELTDLSGYGVIAVLNKSTMRPADLAELAKKHKMALSHERI